MSDRTYAELTGHAPFDWNKWLDAAIEKTPPKDDATFKTYMAADWCMCACGNACAIIPRVVIHDAPMDDKYDMIPIGAPKDYELRRLGLNFYYDIEGGRYSDAKYTLLQIEARSAILIQEELAKLNQQ